MGKCHLDSFGVTMLVLNTFAFISTRKFDCIVIMNACFFNILLCAAPVLNVDVFLIIYHLMREKRETLSASVSCS